MRIDWKSLGANLIGAAIGFVLLVLLAKSLSKPHQKYFYIRCKDAKGNITYKAKNKEYPAGNFLQGLGTCEYVYR